MGAALLGVVLGRVGPAAVARGLTSLGPGVILAATALTLLATLAASWRWSALAANAGRPIPYRRAVASYYRSQLVNASVPGGVLGDVERGARHGGRGSRLAGVGTVVVERFAGQLVQLGLAVLAVLVLPSPLRPESVGIRVAVGLGTLALLGLVGRSGARRIRLSARVVLAVLLASVVVAACHVATFLLVARAVGATASTVALVPIALVVLSAAAIPLNLAGWGPREGASAWLLGSAGLGADTGLAVAVAYGLVALVAVLPGALTIVPRAPRRADAEAEWGHA